MTVIMTSGMRSAPYSAKAARRRSTSMSPLNGWSESMSASSGEGRSSAMRPAELDVGAGGVEVAVVGDDVALLAHHREQDALGGAALVRRDDVLEAGDVVDRVVEVEVRRAAGVGLVAAHDAAPLVGAHRAGAAVGEQVDDHVFGAQREDVVAGVADHLLSLLGGGHLDLLDDLDAERLDDRLEHGASRCHSCAARSS